MEFTIESAQLAKGLSRTQGIVEKRTAMPILSNVLLEAKDEQVKISANDLEVGLSCVHQAKVEKAGSVTVNARFLYEIARGMRDNPITIRRLENNWVQLNQGENEYKLLGMAAEEFVQLPDTSGVELLEVKTDDLRQMIEQTSFAISTDETRYNLNGSFLEKVDNHYRMTATDGHRLAMVDKELLETEGKLQLDGGILLPRKGLMEMRRILEAEEGKVRIGLKENNFVFKVDDVTMVMRLLEGQFPDYQQVVPGEQKVNFQVDRKELMESLRRVNIFSASKANGLKLEIAKNRLRITNSHPDLGEALETLVIEYSGTGMTVGFNARYLLDALAAMSQERVKISLEDDLSPGVFRPVGDDSFTCVIMPMRI